ncbi:chemotaxis protein CheC [Sediminibacillus massiliensis]|uniref:chemotaxis protein CheC n=1 Tax=Sediminibacillus massiliensis TaxID=1926277 RepID=UPI00098846ED|nr:chemotaxis protein CheC [Sediminibacillus massiliensis]
MSFLEKLTNYQLDTLKEIGNLGAGRAASALSQIVNKRISMEVPSVRISSFEEAADIIGGPDKVIVAVYLRVEGEAPGSMFYLLTPEQAVRFVQHINGNKKLSAENPVFSDMEWSLLQELGNILSGAYLTSLSDFTNLHMSQTVPSVSVDMAGAILPQGLLELSKESDHAIIVDTIIQEEGLDNEHIQGHFFFLPDPSSFEKIFEALGIQE